ncbi:hypothetical protein BGZ83_011144, partial [Gryganskiella cystojenkinii]
MLPWYLRTLPCQTGLNRATAFLADAHNSKDPNRAKKFCDKAKESLERITIPATSPLDLDQVIVKYCELGAALEKWGFKDDARVSYSTANELSVDAGRGALTPPPVGISMVPVSSPSLAPGSIPSFKSALTNTCPPGTVIASQDKGASLASIFTKDHPPLLSPCDLPGPDARLIDTQQLALCLALLRASPLSDGDTLIPSARKWLTVTKNNLDEQERLKAMATDLIRAYTRDELKGTKATAEVLLLAPVLEKEDYQILLSRFVNEVEGSVLMDIQSLEGLALLLQGASPDYLDSDDLVKITELLSSRLQQTHQQSPEHIYKFTLAVSRVLDAMVDCEVKGLNRVNLHGPLLSYLESLKSNKDPYLVFQAAYAYQALLFVPDDESNWQATLRRSGMVLRGVSGLVSAVKGLNINDFIEGLGHIQGGLEGVGQVYGLAKDAYKELTTLMESGQSLLDALKTGLSFSRKCNWYPLLRCVNLLLRNGELIKFKTLVYEAPYPRDPAFLWGVCQHLGDLALDSGWDIESRQGAIAFLGDIYKNDPEWGKQSQVKQCVLDILLQLRSVSAVKVQVETLLQELADDGNEGKRALYKGCIKTGPTAHLLKAASPLVGSSLLLDLVQNKPSVEPALRKYQRRRLLEQGHRNLVYIPPQAKATREAPDDELFDLTHKVNEFLSSNKKVLLVLGDSGAGKSTFNMELEIELWKAYNKNKKQIPIFITLPAIKEPEQNLITKQLRTYDFHDAQIQELKSFYEFVLICDGYDECKKRDNLYYSNRLNMSGEWKVKMVISCRSEYLGSDYRLLFQPGSRNDRSSAVLFQEAVIAPFSKDKIQDYIRQYVQKYENTKESNWRQEDYWHTIESIPNLQELVKNPFLLTLALEVLPLMVDPTQDMTLAKVSRVTLYDHFLEQWVERGQRRLIERDLTAKEHETFDLLTEDGFSKNALLLVKELAVAIFEHQDGRPVVDYSPIGDETTWRAAFFGRDHAKNNLLREVCPLNRQGNQFRFIHRSILEYGLARAVFEPLSHGTQEQSELGNHVMKQEPISPLYRKRFVHEPSILHFLAERVQQETRFKQELLSYIERSKIDEKWSTAAANAITILVRAGTSFNRVDLNNIKIRGADLSYGLFDSAQMQGADLRQVKMRSIWLRQANLNKTQMEGVEFGEWPYLSVQSVPRCCAFSPDGNKCVIGHDDGSILVYDTTTWENLLNLQGHTKLVASIVYSPNGQQIASGGDDGTIRLWDAHSGTPGLILQGHTDDINSIAISPDGQQIASGSDDKTVRLWDVKTGAPGPIFQGHSDYVHSVMFSPNGQQIASGSHDQTLRLWDVLTGAPGLILQGYSEIIRCVAFSPNGQHIASGSFNGTVRLWDARSGTPGLILRGHSRSVVSMAFSPNGHQIASGSDDKTIRLWDAHTGAPGMILQGHYGYVRCVAFSPNGQRIASGGDDKTVRLWDVHTGTPGRMIPQGHTRLVASVAYSPDGQQIASGSDDLT